MAEMEGGIEERLVKMGGEEGNNSGGPKFPAFPFEPYSIQTDFMNALYRSLDQGGVSMLESPTGTGKTLSVICSALQWVIDRKQEERLREGEGESYKNGVKATQVGLDDEPDWLRNFVVNKGNQGHRKSINKIKKKFQSLLGEPDKKSYGDSYDLDIEDSPTVKGSENLQKKIDAVVGNDQEFLLEEYESEDEEKLGSRKLRRKGRRNFLSSSSEEDLSDDNQQEEEKFKIYFCSRTHSQLSQFIKELRKTVFANEIDVVCLGSRKSLCINEEVIKLKHCTRINEHCLELQKSKKKQVSKIKNLGTAGRLRRKKASSGCPMLKNRKLQRQFQSEVSQQGAMDIEDLARLGRSVGTCPYYGSRSMISAADLVVLPYQSLLSKSSRESLGLHLKNNIIIIDEAHNLADCLINMYDSKITLEQLNNVHSHLEKYFGRFCNLLGAGNRRYIQTLMVLTRAFLRTLLNESDRVHCCQNILLDSELNKASNVTMSINDFVFSLNIDNINLVKLLQYIKESNIMHKVSGYGEKLAVLERTKEPGRIEECCAEESTLSSFQALVDVLISLTNNNSDGKIIVSRSNLTSSCKQGGHIKHVMLSGEKIFSQIADQAHAVLLVGGTLQPVEETRERLFPWLPSNQLHFFSCGHIVPPDNILPVAVSRGPSGRTFDFSYNSRSLPEIIQELGFLLCNLASVVPEAIVVFFSSFDYEGQVYEAWKATGILKRLLKKKLVFREPRKSTEVEYVLKEYKETIDALYAINLKETATSHTGAVLLAVVGGKISEGINLSDGMGRCIVMVGLPYPSPSDIELLERVKHIEGLANPSSANTTKFNSSFNIYKGDVQSGFNILRSCRHRGKEYYENLCMKAVNQSIGRAIRHINDYAAILLVDQRYSSHSSQRSFYHPTNKLPQWIKDCLVSSTNNYGEVHRLLHQFFKLKKKV